MQLACLHTYVCRQHAHACVHAHACHHPLLPCSPEAPCLAGLLPLLAVADAADALKVALGEDGVVVREQRGALEWRQARAQQVTWGT